METHMEESRQLKLFTVGEGDAAWFALIGVFINYNDSNLKL